MERPPLRAMTASAMIRWKVAMRFATTVSGDCVHQNLMNEIGRGSWRLADPNRSDLPPTGPA
jgi:hypothetical protein